MQVNEWQKITINSMIGLNGYANKDNISAGRSCSMYLVIRAVVFMKVIKVLKIMQSILGMSKVI